MRLPDLEYLALSFVLVFAFSLTPGTFLPGLLSDSVPDAAAGTGGSAEASELDVQAFAPAFNLKTMAGDRTVGSAELFVGRAFTLLVFWNSDCPDCVEALKQCQGLAEAARKKGVELVGVNHDIENVAAVRALLARQGVSFLQLRDPYRLVASSYGADAYSFALFLVDSSGVIHETVYGRPADVNGAVSAMLERAASVPVSSGSESISASPEFVPSGPESLSTAPRPVPAAPGVVSRVPDSISELPEPAAERFETSRTPRISVTGEARLRAMNIRLRDDTGALKAPTGPYGEAIRQGSSSAHRIQCELSGKITESLTAGVLLRLSNEDEAVLVLGPQYFSRSEGSAYAQYRSKDFMVRLGYFDAHFTPLSLMIWDSEDNARTGGTASGCACAGVTGAILLESLEELGPELTFEGMSVSHSAGELLDLRAFYARPRLANEISAGDFLADPEALEDFAYQRDLYALRANVNVQHPSFASPALMSLLYVRTVDDDRSATFVGSQYDPRGFASDNRVYGALISVPLHDRLSMEVDLERAETYDNVLNPAEIADWGTALLGTLRGRVTTGVSVSASYLSLSEEFHSAYAALSYLPNRTGVRASVSVRRGGFSSDLFAKFLKPYAEETTFTPDFFPPATRARFKSQLTLGAWASRQLFGDLELGGGWLLERVVDDVSRPLPGPLPPAGYEHLKFQKRKNIFTLQLLRALAARSSGEFVYQYVDYTDKIEPANDYSLHRTSLQFSIRF
ncbi:MAG: TlpA family protein disulfide reductase [Candidatus Eiseniibacteriota bacterium]|nr:MAG: TlpA family protein disulfide reductase [Candidatus Eisenbacteria bacterium]